LHVDIKILFGIVIFRTIKFHWKNNRVKDKKSPEIHETNEYWKTNK